MITLPLSPTVIDWENIIVKNEEGTISAWDAYWYQAIYLNNGFTLYPNKSHVINEGFDGTGMHCSDTNDWKTPLNSSETKRFPKKIFVLINFRITRKSDINLIQFDLVIKFVIFGVSISRNYLFFLISI